jgi:hypothetical protein
VGVPEPRGCVLNKAQDVDNDRCTWSDELQTQDIRKQSVFKTLILSTSHLLHRLSTVARIQRRKCAPCARLVTYKHRFTNTALLRLQHLSIRPGQLAIGVRFYQTAESRLRGSKMALKYVERAAERKDADECMLTVGTVETIAIDRLFLNYPEVRSVQLTHLSVLS